jgi:hypothetical protein
MNTKNTKIKIVENIQNYANDECADNNVEGVNTTNNIIIKIKETMDTTNKFLLPSNITIIKAFSGHSSSIGKSANQILNNYWLVCENNKTNVKYYAMYCKVNKITYISEKSINYILINPTTKKAYTWYLMKNGYIGAHCDNGGLYLHQLIAKTEMGEGKEGQSVDHINRNKMDNRIENLRWATQSEQNSNTDKRKRKYNAKPLPDGLKHSDLPKYVVYYHEILDKETGRFREYFKIEKHPKLDKVWIGSKSKLISIQDKLKAVKNKLNELDKLNE